METKKGYRTSEFWLTTIGSILTLLNQSGALGSPLPIEPIMMVMGSIATYAMSRGFAKKGG
jgi:hypothetical protein